MKNLPDNPGRSLPGFLSDFQIRLCLLFLFGPFFMLQANTGYSQKTKVTLDLQNVTIERLIDEIESKTDFLFVYKSKDVDLDRLVTIKAKKEQVASILERVFDDSNTAFNIINQQIFLTERKPRPAEQQESSISEDPIRVTGKVTSVDGMPLPGASVMVIGTAIGVSTDVNGNYNIEVPNAQSELEFSFIGYSTQRLTVGRQTTINVALEESLGQLEEVVVSTGYYTTEQRLATGNISKVDAKTIERQPVLNPLEALQGQVPGIFIQQTSGIPGAAVNVRIRGLNSLNNGQRLNGAPENLPNANQPFYVVDGVPFPANSLNSDLLGLRGGSPLAFLRPSDIESIEVLKDADATAIYGSRGANGVIVITTKKGKSDKLQVNADYSHGITDVPNRMRVLNTPQYLQMRREAIANDGGTLTAADSVRLSDVFLWDQNRYTDWQEVLFGTGEEIRTGVSISGGSETTRFLFSTNYLRRNSIYNFDDSRFESVSGNLNLNHQSQDNRFNANFSVILTVNDNLQRTLAGSIAAEAYTTPPNAPPLFDERGELNWEDNFMNPIRKMENVYTNVSENLNTRAMLSYELLKGLTLETTIGYTKLNTEETQIFPQSGLAPEERNPRSSSSELARGDNTTLIAEPRVSYNTSIGEGQLSVLLGSTFQNTSTERITFLGIGFASDLFIRNIQAANVFSLREDDFSEYRYSAIFSRINYSWKNKYILNLTGRRDGSSRFGPNRRFGNFGAIGAAWIFSDENFFQDKLPFLNFGKLRGSYGLTGNDNIGDYQFLNTYLVLEDSQDNNNSALSPVRAANVDYSWETNKMLEVGMELGFFNNRVSLNTVWYRGRTSDQLIGRPLAAISGFRSVQFNLPAIVENRGIEIVLKTTNIRTDQLVWTSSLNFTQARNELAEFPNMEEFAFFNNTYVIGESILGSKQYRSLGVDPETGRFLIEDANGDGRISQADRQTYVEIRDDFFGGLNNSISWKGFQLDFLFRFVKQNGRDIINGFPVTPGDEIAPGGSFGGNGVNQHVGVLNRWQNPGDITNVQRFSRSSSANLDRIRHNASDGSLADASFIRLQTLSLSWTPPATLFNSKIIETARVFIRGQNLLTITSYEGADPESQGLGLPPLRVITSGVQFSF